MQARNFLEWGQKWQYELVKKISCNKPQNLENTGDIFYFAPGDTNALFTPNTLTSKAFALRENAGKLFDKIRRRRYALRQQ